MLAADRNLFALLQTRLSLGQGQVRLLPEPAAQTRLHLRLVWLRGPCRCSTLSICPLRRRWLEIFQA
jgi:hypothetical protein